MKKTTLLLFLLCFSLLLNGQTLIQGYVDADEEDLGGTVVFNTTTQDFGITDDGGYYEVKGKIGDHLTFDRLGYEPQEMVVKDLEEVEVVFMKATTYELPVAIVQAKGAISEEYVIRCGGVVKYTQSIASQDAISISAHFDPISIYPNPTRGPLTVDGPETSIKVEIFTAGGVQIDQCRLNREKRIDLSAYPAGTYFLRFLDPDGQLIGYNTAVKVDL